VEALAEIGDAGLCVLVTLLAGIERGFERGKLAPQRRDLLIQQPDLGERPGRDPLLGFDLAVERGNLTLRRAGAAVQALVQALDAVTLAFGAHEARTQLRDGVLQARLAGLLQRQHVGELGNLRVEAGWPGPLFTSPPPPVRLAPPAPPS